MCAAHAAGWDAAAWQVQTACDATAAVTILISEACNLPRACFDIAPGRLLLLQDFQCTHCGCSSARALRSVHQQRSFLHQHLKDEPDGCCCGALQAVHVRGLAYMLQLPRALPETADTADDAHASASSSSAAEQTAGAAALPAPTGWSTEGLPRVLRHGTMHLPPYARLAAQSYSAFGPDLLRQVGSQVQDCRPSAYQQHLSSVLSAQTCSGPCLPRAAGPCAKQLDDIVDRVHCCTLTAAWAPAQHPDRCYRCIKTPCPECAERLGISWIVSVAAFTCSAANCADCCANSDSSS